MIIIYITRNFSFHIINTIYQLDFNITNLCTKKKCHAFYSGSILQFPQLYPNQCLSFRLRRPARKA